MSRIRARRGMWIRFFAAALAAGAAGCGGDEAGDAAGDVGTDWGEEGEDGGDGEGEEGTDAALPTPCELASAATVETVAMLAVGRYSPVAAVLADGRALIAGGYDFTRGAQRSAELFDPATDALGPTGSLRQGRNFPATVLAPDGRVLVFGGFHPSYGSDNKVEIYDAAAGTFDYASVAMAVGREAHTATLLQDGRVLVAGGLQALGFEFHAGAELFDAVAGTFTATAVPMNVRRAFHAAVSLPSGDVLLVGGDSGSGELSTAERYLVADDQFWNTAGALPNPAKAVAAVALDDGTVLVAGGANAADGTLADASRYDPAPDRFAATGSMTTRRMAHTLTKLADGRVLAVGGWSDTESPSASTGALEVYDPASGTWTALPVELARSRLDHAALLLPDCRVLVAGGQSVEPGVAPVAPLELELVTVPTRRPGRASF